MSRKKKWISAIFIVLVAAITLILYIQSQPQKQNQQQGAAGKQLLQFKVTKEDIANSIEVTGKSSYVKETLVYAPFTAEVKTWHTNEGKQVSKGDLLFELDDSHLRNEITLLQTNQLKEQLAQKLQRLRESVSTAGSTSQQEETAETKALNVFAHKEEVKIQDQLDQINRGIAQAELTDKQNQLAKASFTAQDSGIFLFQDKKLPQTVKQQEAVGRIVDLSKQQLICKVGEQDVFQIHPGMAVEVRVDALKQTQLNGKVEHVSKFALTGTEQGTSSAQFEVIISLEPNDKLIAGLSLTGMIQTVKKQAVVVVPTIAVQRENELYYVFLENGTSVEKRIIKIGLETADKTEVLEGLKEGDTVVLQ